MNPSSSSLLVLLAATLLTTSCKQSQPSPEETSTPDTLTIERLSHTKGTFSVAETITLKPDQKEFTLGGKKFTLKSRWDDAEVTRRTTNKNPREAHAVELTWNVGTPPKTNSLWLFPTTENSPAPLLAGTQIQARLLPPGTRMTQPADLKQSLLLGTQFQWKNKRYNLTKIGDEIFPGWKLTAIRTFQHALLGDNGIITETADASFTNRAVEATIEAEDGSKERHICFIDHPQLTAGIHPSLLPVSRISGNLSSLARLVVCETAKRPVEKSLLTISPDTNGNALTIWTWLKGKPTPTSQHITRFPTTLTLDKQAVTITRHWTHARREIKWQQKENPSGTNKQPALLIESASHFHSKPIVLIQGKPTPCRISGNMMILRYR